METQYDNSDIPDERSNLKESRQNQHDVYPVFDILDELYKEGCHIKNHASDFFLFDDKRNVLMHGNSFRDLCVNIVLAGL